MSSIDTKYIALCKEILAKGNVKSDRTGTGTISLFGAEIRHDLQESFPLLTTKSVHFKSVVGELLWLLSGSTNIKFLTDNNIRIWNEWADKDGEIGMLYPASWRYWYSPSNELVQVGRRTDKYEDYKYPYNTEFLPKIDCDLNTDDVWAVKNLGADSRNTRYLVQMKSGFLLEISRPNWRSSKGSASMDKYHKGAHGVGFLGDYKVWDERTYNLWYNMIARCYNKDHPNYKFYGGAGVTVSPIWLSYHKFYETLNQLAGFTFWKSGGDLELDKDYFGSKVYSPSTCIFVPKSHNSGIRTDGGIIEIQGKKYSSIMEWAGYRKSISWYANKRWKQGLPYKGIEASEVEIIQPDEGMLWRKRVYVDQISDLIEGLKNDPDSRRHLVTAWNPSFLPFQSLPSCHHFFQCYVNDGKLSLMFNMRSNDFFLGNPFNIASYALLAHMLSQVCNLEVGELIWRGGDVHIYQNHVEQIKTQIARYENGEVFEAPTLVLNKGVTDIDDFTFDDIRIENYKNAGKLTGEVAI